MSIDKTREIVNNLSEEEIRELDRLNDLAIYERVKARRLAQEAKETMDSIRTMFRRKCTPEFKAEEVEVFMGCNLYDYLCTKYDEEDMHEFLWGDTLWEDYMAAKKARLAQEAQEK